MTLWPSGLRRNVKAVVLIGGGSNPLDVNFMIPKSLFGRDSDLQTLAHASIVKIDKHN